MHEAIQKVLDIQYFVIFWIKIAIQKLAIFFNFTSYVCDIGEIIIQVVCKIRDGQMIVIIPPSLWFPVRLVLFCLFARYCQVLVLYWALFLISTKWFVWILGSFWRLPPCSLTTAWNSENDIWIVLNKYHAEFTHMLLAFMNHTLERQLVMTPDSANLQIV